MGRIYGEQLVKEERDNF